MRDAQAARTPTVRLSGLHSGSRRNHHGQVRGSQGLSGSLGNERQTSRMVRSSGSPASPSSSHPTVVSSTHHTNSSLSLVTRPTNYCYQSHPTPSSSCPRATILIRSIPVIRFARRLRALNQRYESCFCILPCWLAGFIAMAALMNHQTTDGDPFMLSLGQLSRAQSHMCRTL